MKLRYFIATAFSAVVAVSFLPKAVAGSNYKLVEDNGKVYCITTTAGTCYYAGQNVSGFGINGETDRAEYSSTVPVNPENGNTGNVDK